jgi:hypothetical protein
VHRLEADLRVVVGVGCAGQTPAQEADPDGDSAMGGMDDTAGPTDLPADRAAGESPNDDVDMEDAGDVDPDGDVDMEDAGDVDPDGDVDMEDAGGVDL